jgi:hypothetical protein
MTTTATPATVAPRMHRASTGSEFPEVSLRGAGARLHTDRVLDPTTQRIVLDAEAAADAAQADAGYAWAARADMVQENNAMRADLFRAHQQIEAYRAELEHVRAQLTAERPVIEMAGLVAHGHRGVADVRQAYTTYVEEGPR